MLRVPEEGGGSRTTSGESRCGGKDGKGPGEVLTYLHCPFLCVDPLEPCC